MQVQCPQCGAGGKIPDNKIPAQGRKIVCPKCKHAFLVRKPAASPSAAADPEPLFQEGLKLLKARQTDAAIEKFNAAIQINPQYSDAYRYLGLAYGQKNLWHEASEVLQQAISSNPQDTQSLKNLGIAYLQMKRFEEAEQVLQQALHYAPNDDKARSFLAKAQKGRQQSATTPAAAAPASSAGTEPLTDLSGSASPVHTDPVNELLDKGTEFLENAQYSKAIETFSEVTRIAPDSSNGYFGLGMVYEKRGDVAKAIGAYKKAVDVNPDDTLARENLKYLKKHKKKFRLPFGKK